MMLHELFNRIHSETKQQIILKLKVHFQTARTRVKDKYKEQRRKQNEEAQFARECQPIAILTYGSQESYARNPKAFDFKEALYCKMRPEDVRLFIKTQNCHGLYIKDLPNIFSFEDYSQVFVYDNFEAYMHV